MSYRLPVNTLHFISYKTILYPEKKQKPESDSDSEVEEDRLEDKLENQKTYSENIKKVPYRIKSYYTPSQLEIFIELLHVLYPKFKKDELSSFNEDYKKYYNRLCDKYKSQKITFNNERSIDILFNYFSMWDIQSIFYFEESSALLHVIKIPPETYIKYYYKFISDGKNIFPGLRLKCMLLSGEDDLALSEIDFDELKEKEFLYEELDDYSDNPSDEHSADDRFFYREIFVYAVIGHCFKVAEKLISIFGIDDLENIHMYQIILSNDVEVAKYLFDKKIINTGDLIYHYENDFMYYDNIEIMNYALSIADLTNTEFDAAYYLYYVIGYAKSHHRYDFIASLILNNYDKFMFIYWETHSCVRLDLFDPNLYYLIKEKIPTIVEEFFIKGEYSDCRFLEDLYHFILRVEHIEEFSGLSGYFKNAEDKSELIYVLEIVKLMIKKYKVTINKIDIYAKKLTHPYDFGKFQYDNKYRWCSRPEIVIKYFIEYKLYIFDPMFRKYFKQIRNNKQYKKYSEASRPSQIFERYLAIHEKIFDYIVRKRKE